MGSLRVFPINSLLSGRRQIILALVLIGLVESGGRRGRDKVYSDG